MTGHGATKRPTGDGVDGYDDPGGKAATACQLVALKAQSVADGKAPYSPEARLAATQSAYGACALGDPAATADDVAPVATTPAGVACRTLINGLAGRHRARRDRRRDDPGSPARRRRPLHADMGRAHDPRPAAAAIGDVVQPGDSGAEEVIVIAFDGSFEPPSAPAGGHARSGEDPRVRRHRGWPRQRPRRPRRAVRRAGGHLEGRIRRPVVQSAGGEGRRQRAGSTPRVVR